MDVSFFGFVKGLSGKVMLSSCWRKEVGRASGVSNWWERNRVLCVSSKVLPHLWVYQVWGWRWGQGSPLGMAGFITPVHLLEMGKERPVSLSSGHWG